MITKSAIELIGNTPMLEASRYARLVGIGEDEWFYGRFGQLKSGVGLIHRDTFQKDISWV